MIMFPIVITDSHWLASLVRGIFKLLRLAFPKHVWLSSEIRVEKEDRDEQRDHAGL